jgi:hypothetical protein
MAVIIQSESDSAVSEADKDVYTQTYIEDKKTVIGFDMRKRDYQKEFGITSEIFWSVNAYHIDIYEFSTFHNPVIYRFVMAQGNYFDEKNQRIFFTPEPSEVSTCHHAGLNILRLSCFLAVICGVSLRNTALRFSVLFQIPAVKQMIRN